MIFYAHPRRGRWKIEGGDTHGRHCLFARSMRDNLTTGHIAARVVCSGPACGIVSTSRIGRDWLFHRLILTPLLARRRVLPRCLRAVLIFGESVGDEGDGGMGRGAIDANG